MFFCLQLPKWKATSSCINFSNDSLNRYPLSNMREHLTTKLRIITIISFLFILYICKIYYVIILS